MKLVALGSIVLALHLVGQDAPAPSAVPQETGSTVSQKEAQQALDFHNAKRSEVGAPALAWSVNLARDAQAWADHLAKQNNCGLAHNPAHPHGENLFGGRGMFFSAKSASEAWYSEVKAYQSGDTLSQQNVNAIGHYTQMMWSGTTSVGIGQAACGSATVIVGEYDPAGNVLGQKPY